MSVVVSPRGDLGPLREQLAIIMGALTKAAVAEICQVVDEGYAVLQMEITRSRKENEDLRKKLHLIESIVVWGGKAPGTGAGDPEPPELGPAGENASQPGDSDGIAAGGGGVVLVVPEELPDVVLIKDEDSNDAFEKDKKTQTDNGTSHELATSTPVSRTLKRHWAGTEEPDAKSSETMTVYNFDSPRAKAVFAGPLDGPDIEAGESVCSYSSQMDPDVQLVHQESSLVPPGPNRQYFGMMESPANRKLDLSLTCTKQSKGPTALPHFHENLENDAFGLKMVSVTGSADIQELESSNSAFEYDENDLMNYHYQDQSGRPQPGIRGRRFVCTVCAKTYATSQNLEVHMRIHTGERPFACSQCGKKFTQSAHLKSHLSVHSGERPYACLLCSRSFIVKYSLKLHMKKCHGDGE